MLDIKFIRENPEKIKKVLEDKKIPDAVDVDKLLELDKQYLELLRKAETHRSLKNELSKDISKVTGEAKDKLLAEATKVKNDLGILEQELDVVKKNLDEELLKLPNLVSDDTPVGKDESENVVLRRWGKPTKFGFEPKDHVDLGVPLDLIDIETATKISGSRFFYLKNEAVLMQFALVQFVLQTLTNPKIIAELAKKVNNPYTNVFTPVVPPVLMRPEVMNKMGRLNPIEERYYIPSDPLVLVGSAEHTLGPIFMDQTLKANQLPVRFIGYSTAFRREAGTYGKDMKGILRVHQFDKLEMETFVPQEIGLQEQDLLVAIQEYLMQQLELPYEVMILCTGDMGKPDYRQIDINTWVPAQNKYRETHSADYMTDYQARRLNIKYEDAEGNRKFVYMNDATALAIGRTLIAILENNQQEDGSIKIPRILQQYLNGKEIIVRK
ncbi:MAG TPA: serine--tRNA ligase [Candidatus Saccharimonadales bacterium]|nr:serine--tRNA ligase [Candidatus Saccharimonadales bacterium]